MKTLIFVFILMLCLNSYAQPGAWHIQSSIGNNFSLNRMILLDGQEKRMQNKSLLLGYWDLLFGKNITQKSQIIFGFELAGYGYNYNYQIENVSGGGSKASIYIWGLPLGIENNWMPKKKLSLSTNYGLKLRFTKLGGPITLNASEFIFNANHELVFRQDLHEFEFKNSAYNVSFFVSTKLLVQVKETLSVFIKIHYNQGVNVIDSFRFKGSNTYFPIDIVTEDNYQFLSRGSYLSTGIGISYVFSSGSK